MTVDDDLFFDQDFPLISDDDQWVSDESLMHYGIARKSGRYPWGSGDDEYSRSMQFYGYVNALKAQGNSPTEIAKALGLSVAQLRDTTTIAKEARILAETNRAVTLRDKGTSIEAIAKELDIPAPTVRLRLKNSENKKESTLRGTADMLRAAVDEHKIVDIGKGTELSIQSSTRLGISPEKLRAAVSLLRDEGYETYNLKTPQVGTKNNTNQLVIVPPGTGYGPAKKMTDQIHTLGKWTEDEGATYLGLHPPLVVDPKRLQVKFAEDGGTKEDGTVYVRPDVPDLDMGKHTYAQVRIQVGPGHFIKGVAIKNPDLPDGIDLVFNTNKKRGTPIFGDKNNSVLKTLKDDPDNPFGSVIKRQLVDIDPKTGKERVRSALNIVNEAGDWDDWRNSLPSQMLAKQPHPLIKSQLALTRAQAADKLKEIESITNAVVRKAKYQEFADQVDADAVDLRAAAMPRQRTQLIVPMPKMNKGEIYAPRFENGEKVVLIRYPHGGKFEIPEVTVNNNNRTAKKLLGDAPDAIGIHPSVAEKLSGADFDGDTVVVIPNRDGKVKGSESLGRSAKVYEDGLKNFDAKAKYGNYEEKDGKGNFPLMKNTGLEMGMITNLITDMSIQGASPEHVVRAVKHSMVVIDAEKHRLDYRRSAQDNGIDQLRSLYQTRVLPDGTYKTGGATTLLSRATSEERVPDRKLRSAQNGGPVDPTTGALRYEATGKQTSVYDPKTQTYTAEKRDVETGVKRLALTDDAYTLVRDKADPVEKLYADHVNEMKALANAARLRDLRTPNPPTNKEAKAVFKPEVDKLVEDLRTAQRQAPLDRRAQVYAGMTVKAKRDADPMLRTDKDRLKKIERQAIAAARSRLGLKRPVIDISDKQWDAIQSGAVSPSRLSEILRFADPKRVAELSMPRANTVVTTAVASRAKAMLSAGVSAGDVAAALGISVSTLRAAAERGDV